jgi:hypothetical protein
MANRFTQAGLHGTMLAALACAQATAVLDERQMIK